MTKKTKIVAVPAVEVVAVPVVKCLPARDWVGVAEVAATRATSRGKWLAFIMANEGKTLAELQAIVEAGGMPASAKEGSKHAYTLPMWVNWMVKANIIELA